MPPDPAALYRVRDGVYASDLLVAAVAEFDVFSWLARRGRISTRGLCAELGLAARPTDVALTYCAALGLVDRELDHGDEVDVTELARTYLVQGSPFDLRAYYTSLAERPGVREFVAVLRTDIPAAWASVTDGAEAKPGHAWSARLDEIDFARRSTAAMDGPPRTAASSWPANHHDEPPAGGRLVNGCGDS